MAVAKHADLVPSENSDSEVVSRFKKEMKFIRKEVFKLKQGIHQPKARRTVPVLSTDTVVHQQPSQNQNCCSDRLQNLESEFSSLQENLKDHENAVEHVTSEFTHLEVKSGKCWDLLRD